MSFVTWTIVLLGSSIGRCRIWNGDLSHRLFLPYCPVVRSVWIGAPLSCCEPAEPRPLWSSWFHVCSEVPSGTILLRPPIRGALFVLTADFSLLFGTFSVNLRGDRVWEPQEISSSWNRRARPAPTAVPHSRSLSDSELKLDWTQLHRVAATWLAEEPCVVTSSWTIAPVFALQLHSTKKVLKLQLSHILVIGYILLKIPSIDPKRRTHQRGRALPAVLMDTVKSNANSIILVWGCSRKKKARNSTRTHFF